MSQKIKNAYLVIMAGGIGSRFWPESRTDKPKQFLDILNIGKTLIQLTYERHLDIIDEKNIFIVTNKQYEKLVLEQLPQLPKSQLLLEPNRKNTAPCIAYACHRIHSLNKDARVLVCPSDHLILREGEYRDVIKKGFQFLEKHDSLLTLGMKPNRPDTGYGYIQFNPGSESELGSGIYKVKTFTEKPSLDIAKTFLQSGEFLWNSGMFLWRSQTILEEIKELLPEIHDAFDGLETQYGSAQQDNLIEKAYSLCTNISIDFGVMEKSKRVHILPAQFGWSDIGTWASLYQLYEKDYLQNAVSGKNVKIYDAANNMIMVPSGKLVVLEGLDGFCIIDTKDVLLICSLDKEQEIKNITNDLRLNKLDKFL